MDGIATILDEFNYARVQALWRELEERCGMTGIKITPIPHFSWHIAEAYDEERVIRVLQEICAQARPFTARTAGLGVFTGEKPVVYIPLVKDRFLLEFHTLLWNRIKDLGRGVSTLYSPSNWVPHITVVFEDLTPHNLTCAMDFLVFEIFDWMIPVNNLALIGRPEAQVGMECYRQYFGSEPG